MSAPDPAQALAQACADAMWAADRASQAMGIKVEAVAPGQATISMRIRPDMIGPGGACSRGAVFLIADSALAFASNTRGQRVVAQYCDILFDQPAGEGEELVAEATERHVSDRKGIYDVRVRTREGRTIAEMRGHAHILRDRIADAPRWAGGRP